MSRRIDICPTCKGKGEIIVDDWLTEGMTEEELVKKKEKALSDIVEVVRCRDCKHNRDNGGDCDRTIILNEYDSTEYRCAGLEYCSYGERSENGT